MTQKSLLTIIITLTTIFLLLFYGLQNDSAERVTKPTPQENDQQTETEKTPFLDFESENSVDLVVPTKESPSTHKEEQESELGDVGLDSPDSTAQTSPLKKYGNEVATAIGNHVGDQAEISETLNNFLDEPSNKNRINDINNLSNKYINAFNELSTLNVPEQVEPLHKDYSESFLLFSESLSGLAEVGPTESSIKKLNEVSISLSQKHLLLVDFFEDNDVNFSSNEPGYIFERSF